MQICVIDSTRTHFNEIVHMIEKWSEEIQVEFVQVNFVNAFILSHYTSYIISLDQNLMDGFQLANRIRSYNDHANVVFMSKNPENAVRAFEFNNIDFLGLPIHEQYLRKTMDLKQV